jgi:putative protease
MAKKPELLSPAGDWPSLVSAVEAGADSVYFGLKFLNMRANAHNFELSEMKKVVDYCHEHKVKCYLTLNSIVFDNELVDLEKIIKTANQNKVDAVICWDFSVMNLCKRYKIPFIISTQASISNIESVKFFESLGAKRIILARELSLEQIKKIKENSKVEIEFFVHGALCVSVSGRCFTSQFLFKKSANRGDCLQPCRRQYKVTDVETNDELKLDNNFVMSPKDLCALPFVDKLMFVDAFKIEGRNRSPEYVKVVTEVYRRAIDAAYENKFDENLKKQLIEKLKTVYNRKFSSGFILGVPTNDDWTDVYGSAATKTKIYVGKVRNYFKKVSVAEIKITDYGLSVGDSIMVQGNKTGVFETVVKSMQYNHKEVKKAKQGDRVGIKIDREVRPQDKVFVVKDA